MTLPETLITTRDYTLAHLEGRLYRMVKLGNLGLIPSRQDVVMVQAGGEVTDPVAPFDRRYLMGMAIMDSRLSSRRGGMLQN